MIYVTKLRDMICINIRHHMEYPSNSTTDLSTTLHVHETWRMKKVVGTADNSLQMRTTKRFVINLYISDPYLYLHAGTVMGVEIRAQHAHNMEISVNMCMCSQTLEAAHYTIHCLSVFTNMHPRQVGYLLETSH